jgi:hypothetical protein
MDVMFSPYSYYSGVRDGKSAGFGFLESIFSYVFGDGNPNEGMYPSARMASVLAIMAILKSSLLE